MALPLQSLPATDEQVVTGEPRTAPQPLSDQVNTEATPYRDAAGTLPCATVPQQSGTTLYVIAKTAGASANGITGAEFRIEVTNPTGWWISYNAPSGSVNLGNPLDVGSGAGLSLSFTACQTGTDGKVTLGTLSIYNQSGAGTNLLVRRHSTPSNSGYSCPLFVRCDGPTFSKVCMTPSTEPACSLSAKAVSIIAADPIVFSASLNGGSEESGPGGSFPDRQVIAAFRPGVITLPSGETGATLQSTSISSAAVDTVLEQNEIEYIWKAFPTFDLADTTAVARTGEVVRLANLSNVYVIRLPTGGNPQSLAEELEELLEDVAYAEADGIAQFEACPTDNRFGEQWSLRNTGQTGGTADADIYACEAWDLTTGGLNTKIAIIDTGVDQNHEDLAGKVIGHQGFGDSSPGEADAHHGTHVAGIAAAYANNTLGIAGVDHNATIVSRRIDQNSTSEIAANIRAAVQNNGAQITNNSWHTNNLNSLRLAFRDIYMLNALSVAGMGNDAGTTVFYPAGWPTIMAVGATDDRDIIASWSNTGNHIAVSAPGDAILSTVPVSLFPQKYKVESGTSMAAPHVAGTAGLLLNYGALVGRTLYNDDLEWIIRDSADPKGAPGHDPLYGDGRINAYNALQRLRYPYELTQQKVTGGTIVASSDYQTIRFYVPPSPHATGNYSAKRHEVYRAITFPVAYQSAPRVWGRGVATKGWSAENPNYGDGFCDVVPGTITPTGCTLRTFIYEVRSFPVGTPLGWWPCTAAQVELAYSALGLTTVTDAGDVNETQASTQIRLVAANPILPHGQIALALPSEAFVRFDVFDVAGRRIRRLHEGMLAAGRHVLPWDSRDDQGRMLAPGLYFARVESGSTVIKRKLVLAR